MPAHTEASWPFGCLCRARWIRSASVWAVASRPSRCALAPGPVRRMGSSSDEQEASNSVFEPPTSRPIKSGRDTMEMTYYPENTRGQSVPAKGSFSKGKLLQYAVRRRDASACKRAAYRLRAERKSTYFRGSERIRKMRMGGQESNAAESEYGLEPVPISMGNHEGAVRIGLYLTISGLVHYYSATLSQSANASTKLQSGSSSHKLRAAFLAHPSIRGAGLIIDLLQHHAATPVSSAA